MADTVHFMQYGMTACQKQGLPSTWAGGHAWTGDWEDVTCPQCLEGRESIDTFVVAADGKSITCKRCGRTSHHPQDVEHHFCSNCQVFHDNIWPPSRKWWISHGVPQNMVVVTCLCGFRLGIKKIDLDEIKAGVWGTIPCPKCSQGLNEKIKALDVL